MRYLRRHQRLQLTRSGPALLSVESYHMTEKDSDIDWISQFRIQSDVDLDFVRSQIGWPVGMTRASPPEFRRRVLAAAISYQLQLRSIDYALKRYVDPKEYEVE